MKSQATGVQENLYVSQDTRFFIALTVLTVQTLALNFVLHSIGSSLDTSAVWIDTTGEFSPTRAAKVLAHAKVV